MTVTEYIKALQALPGDLQVIIAAGTIDSYTQFKPAGHPHTMCVVTRTQDGKTILESQLTGHPLQKDCPQFDAVRLA
jgi:hypothetical protein